MKLLKSLYYHCAGLVPLKYLINKNTSSTLFPYHHIVSDQHVPHISNLYPFKNVRQFTEDIDFLLRYFEPVEPVELARYVQLHAELPPRRFLLTFDDGFREVAEVIAPLLLKKGVPAVFFVNPAYIDNKSMFYRNKISVIIDRLRHTPSSTVVLAHIATILSLPGAGLNQIIKALLSIDQHSAARLDQIADALSISFDQYLKVNRPWLTSSELQSLSDKGFQIGGHSWDHSYFQKIALEEQQQQTLSSVEYIRQYSDTFTSFSFPHSDAGLSQQLFDYILQPANQIDLLFGIQNQKLELNNRTIHRFNAERPSVPLSRQVHGVLAYSFIQKVFNQHYIHRQYAEH